MKANKTELALPIEQQYSDISAKIILNLQNFEQHKINFVESEEKKLIAIKSLELTFSELQKNQVGLCALINNLKKKNTQQISGAYTDIYAGCIVNLIKIQITCGDIRAIIGERSKREEELVFYYTSAMQNLQKNMLLLKRFSRMFLLDLVRVVHKLHDYTRTTNTSLNLTESISAIAYRFANICPDDNLKLELYSICFSKMILDSNNPSKIKEFFKEYERLFETIKDSFIASQNSEKKTYIHLIFVHCNFLAARFHQTVCPIKFQSKNRGLNLELAIASKNKRPMDRYVDLLIEKCHKYIEPSFKLLNNIDALELKNYLLDLDHIVKELFFFFFFNFENLFKYYDSLSDKSDFERQRVLVKNMEFLYEILLKYLRFFVQKLTDIKLNDSIYRSVDFIHVEMSNILKKERNIIEKIQEEEQKRILISDKFEKELDMQLDADLKKQMELVETQKNQPLTIIENLAPVQDESRTLLVVSEENPFTKTLEQARTLIQAKNDIQALSLFLNVKFKAQAVLDTEHQAQALDGLICLLAKLLLKQLKEMQDILKTRIQQNNFLSDDMLKRLFLLMQQSQKQFNSLNGFYSELSQLTQKYDLSHIRELFTEIRLLGDQLMTQHSHLQTKKQIRIQQRYKKIGIEEAEERGISDCSEDEIIELGKQKSRRIRQEARCAQFLNENGFYRENKLLSQIPDFLSGIGSQSEKLEQSFLPKDYKKVILAKEIRDAFNFMKSFSQEHYLVGSTVLSLCMKGKFSAHDLDFISATAQRKDLIIAQFRETFVADGHLYVGKLDKQLLEIFKVNNEENWLHKSLQKRDFTIAALACDAEGNIFDSTGTGFADLEAGRLNIIGDPTARLLESPVIALRACKYMMQGFHCSSSLEAALHQWKAADNTNFNHLYATIGSYFDRSDLNKIEFLKLMDHYGLFNKIFPKRLQQGNWNNTFVQVEDFLEIKKAERFGKHRLFNQNQNNPAQLETAVLPLAASSPTNR